MWASKISRSDSPVRRAALAHALLHQFLVLLHLFLGQDFGVSFLSLVPELHHIRAQRLAVTASVLKQLLLLLRLLLDYRLELLHLLVRQVQLFGKLREALVGIQHLASPLTLLCQRGSGGHG